MKNLSSYALIVALLLGYGCGDNLENQPPVVQFPPPAGLKALSVNESTVMIQWSAPSGSADSTFGGYIVQANNRTDTIAASRLTFTVDSLPPGVGTFSVFALRTDGLRSDPASIRWAPATRFDTTYSVYENTTLISNRPEGFNVGTSTTNPSVMVIDLTDPIVQQTMDLFFNGDTVETRQSLSMWSANLIVGSLDSTRFSTQIDFSPSLDFPLGAFPSEDTFVKDSITVIDNAIYYARVTGDPQQVNYARIHLHIRPGTFPPNRIIEVQVSLQRSPGLLFALKPEEAPEGFLRYLSLNPLINYYHS